MNDTWLKESRQRRRRNTRTLKGRALFVIDYILSERMSEDKLEILLYTIAHSATSICSNPHEDWVKETERLYQQFIASPVKAERLKEGEK